MSTWNIENKKSAEEEQRDAVQHLFCGCYGVIIVVLGIVFPIATSLTADGPHDQNFLNVLHTVIHIVGILFILFLAIFLTREAGCTTNHNEKQYDFEKTHGAPVLWNHEGVGLYVRIGTVLFGVATVLLQIFRFIGECRGLLFYINYGTYTFFVVVQTIIALIYHRACIGKFKLLMRWGFAHIIAVNLSQWAYIVTIEVTETLVHKFRKHASDDHSDEPYDNGGHGDQDDHYNGAHDVLSNVTGYINETLTEMVTHAMGADDTQDHHILKRAAGPGPVLPGGCKFGESLQFKTAPYLFPCVIEYSLFMAAIAYKLYAGVGKAPGSESHHEVDHGKMPAGKLFRYLFSGFLGLCALAAGLISVVFIFEKSSEISNPTFHITESVLFPVGIVFTAAALHKTMTMGWKGIEEALDSYLLLVAFFGNLVVDMFRLIAYIDQFNSYGGNPKLSLLKTSFSIIQSIIQVVFILDAMGRCPKNHDQAKQTPGRSIVLFLLLLNVGLWVMSVFELKMQTDTDILDDNYGALAWTIIESACLPLVIFFRFHSTVCLAEIFTESYNLHLRAHSE